MLQRKFDVFQKDLASQEYRVAGVNTMADKLSLEDHTDRNTIHSRKEGLNEAWQRLKMLATSRQQNLYGAQEIQRFNRDADETIAIVEF